MSESRGMTGRRIAFAWTTVLAIAWSSACTREVTAPTGASLTIVAGAGQRDTIDAPLSQALVLEVRNADGRTRSGVTVQFEALATRDSTRSAESTLEVATLAGSGFARTLMDSTDASGRVKALVRLGTIAGEARVAVSVPSFGLHDTVSYTVAAGQPAQISMPTRDTILTVNVPVSIRARAQDRHGNERPADVAQYDVAALPVRVDATGVLTGVSPVRAAIAVRIGTVVDSFRVSIVPQGTIAVVAQTGTGVIPAYQIATVDLDGSHFRTITPVASLTADPQWSPAGDRVVFGTSETGQRLRLFIVDLAGHVQSLTPQVADSADERFAHFSPDGAWVYYARIKPAPTRAELYRIHPDGSGMELFRPLTVRSSTQSEPSPSPDGKTLAYVDAAFIRFMNVSTRAVTALDVVGGYPQFTRDGQHVVYLDQPSGFLRIMALDGSDQHPITTAGQYAGGTGSLSPDGQWIVIRWLRGLHLVRISDGTVIPLTFAASFYQPAFKP